MQDSEIQKRRVVPGRGGYPRPRHPVQTGDVSGVFRVPLHGRIFLCVPGNQRRPALGKEPERAAVEAGPGRHRVCGGPHRPEERAPGGGGRDRHHLGGRRFRWRRRRGAVVSGGLDQHVPGGCEEGHQGHQDRHRSEGQCHVDRLCHVHGAEGMRRDPGQDQVHPARCAHP